MKKLGIIFTLLSLLSISSCVLVYDHGPHGRLGDAYFGVDYHFNPPYSYWDNNPEIPENPYLGEFYWSRAGTYDFEYFVNPYDYWYGTYTIYRNEGTPGGPYGEAGADGLDTYLMLFCDPGGWHEDSFVYKDNVSVTRSHDKISVEVNESGQHFKLEMYKSDILARPSHNDPKFFKK